MPFLADKKRKFKLLLLVSVFIFLYSFVYYQRWSTPGAGTRTVTEIQEEKSVNRSVKYVLYWTTMLGSDKFHFSRTGSELFSNCEHSNCFATSDRSLLQVDQYDALIFYAPRHQVPDCDEEIPKKRSPHQRYIYANSETPLRFYGGKTQYILNNFYNWTMSYRLDSDIPRRHGWVIEQKTNYKLPGKDFVRNKTRPIAWFMSNCQSVNMREHLASQIQKYIDVDIYGDCGTLKCPKNKNCLDMVEKKYMFYLSFENSYCKDYTTEKLYRVLQKNVIPIVYGGGNYNKEAPPHSVINVENFKTIQSLAEYLKYLSTDPDSYLQYFQWKKKYIVETTSARTVCKLCKMLNDPNSPKKVYENIRHWWFNKEKSGCKSGNELPEVIFTE